jgi:RNA polymerase sigma-70 factor (ECF subfamily)
MTEAHPTEPSELVAHLYRTHGPEVLGYLAQLSGNWTMAEDLFQEAFAQVVRHADRLSAVKSLRGWLFGVARNVAMNAVRRQRRFAALPDDVPERRESADPRLEPMRRAIEQLPADLQEILELRLAHSLSYEEIATALEIPVGTVRSRLHRAVGQLRRRLTRTHDI